MHAPQSRPAGLRQAMTGLHLWAGVLAGWLLYAIFITGGVSYFRDELTQWLRPEIPARPATLDAAQVGQLALDALSGMAGDSTLWQINLPGKRGNAVEVAWQTAESEQRAWLDPLSGKPVAARATEAGEFFYYFHFSLHYLPRILARWLVGLCAMFSLVVLVSGVIVHRRIFSDFFTFRPGKGARSWLDAHNSFSVLGLPFHAMIVYTGLVTLMFTYMPWGALAVLGPEQARPALARVMQAQVDLPARTGVPAPLAALPQLMEQAAARWGKDGAARIIVGNPGDAAARIAIVRGDSGRLSVAPASLLFHGVSGNLLETRDSPGPVLKTWGALYALHLGRFADHTLRWLYFLSSLTGAAMVATGMILWSVKRRNKLPAGQRGFGLRLVETGNTACIAGLLAALPAFFLANRLLPPDMAQRSGWEIHCFFLCWGAALVHSCCRRGAQAWREQLLAAALLWATVPLASGWNSGRDLSQSLQSSDWLFVTFDAVFLTVAAILLMVSFRVQRAVQSRPRRT